MRNSGIIDVNVEGVICIGDKLTIGKHDGIGVAIRYACQDEHIFNIRSIGKIIGIYEVYNKAKLLLDVE